MITTGIEKASAKRTNLALGSVTPELTQSPGFPFSGKIGQVLCPLHYSQPHLVVDAIEVHEKEPNAWKENTNLRKIKGCKGAGR